MLYEIFANLIYINQTPFNSENINGSQGGLALTSLTVLTISFYTQYFLKQSVVLVVNIPTKKYKNISRKTGNIHRYISTIFYWGEKQ
jgi:hypothetical protein